MIHFRRPLTTRKVLFVAVGSLLGICIVLWFWTQSIIDRKWNGAKRKLDELRGQLEKRPSSRPLLIGKPSPGSAWEFYEPAINISFAPGDLPYKLHPDGSSGKPDLSTLREAIQKRRNELDLLHEGARRLVL